MHAVLTGMQPAYDAMAMRVRGMQTFHAALHHASASTEAVHAQLPLLETFPILGSGVQGDVREIEVDGELMAIKVRNATTREPAPFLDPGLVQKICATQDVCYSPLMLNFSVPRPL